MKNKFITQFTISLTFFLMSGIVMGQSKDEFTFFNPTPEHLLRGLIPDRPSKADSPYTVDAGHYQVETDLFNFMEDKVKNKEGNTRVRNLQLNNLNLKVGLTNNSDLQLMIMSYVDEQTRESGSSKQKRGFGDTVLRYKYNFFGNDEGGISLGMVPFIKIPTAGAELSNRRTEGGVAIPLSIALPDDWAMSFSFKVDHLKKEHGGSRTDYSLAAGIGHSLVKDLALAVELFTRNSDDRQMRTDTTLDLILTYNVNKKLQLDAGHFIGLSSGAADTFSFVGFSFLY